MEAAITKDRIETTTGDVYTSSNPTIMFRCNLCGCVNMAVTAVQEAPGPLCQSCRSSTRFRLIGYAFSKYILNSSGHLPDAPGTATGLVGIGLSDPPPLARALEVFSGYTNTFYHKEPRVDITAETPKFRNLDYIIASDVFEHTKPPAEVPFISAYKMLKKGGKLILSVPTQENSIEHFPSLNDYRIIESKEGYILVNATRSGSLEIFKNLRFHGGPGATLEMRIFSERQVENCLSSAGFRCFEYIRPDMYEFGIYPLRGLSTVWVATR